VKLRSTAGWISATVALWVLATLAFGIWIDDAVQEEYRLGYRISTDGDSIAIPIAGFALTFGVGLLAASLVLAVVRVVRRRNHRVT
jgi:hypothetical protein